METYTWASEEAGGPWVPPPYVRPPGGEQADYHVRRWEQNQLDWNPGPGVPGGSGDIAEWCAHCGTYLPWHDSDDIIVGLSTLCLPCALRECFGLRELIDGETEAP